MYDYTTNGGSCQPLLTIDCYVNPIDGLYKLLINIELASKRYNYDAYILPFGLIKGLVLSYDTVISRIDSSVPTSVLSEPRRAPVSDVSI